MKKICILICCVMMLGLLTGCTGKNEEFQEPVIYYYCNKEVSYNTPTGVICPETREGSVFYGNLTAFLRAYLLGPKSNTLRSPIPPDVYLVSCEISGGTATIVFSKQFEKLSGIELSTACSALMMTVNEYTGVSTIKISAKDGKIEEKEQITFGIDDIVLMDVNQ